MSASIVYHHGAVNREPVPLCKACRKPIEWRTIRTSDREIQPRVFERAYICPHCRAVQEFASWQTGVSRRG
jgi:hypothetical protein